MAKTMAFWIRRKYSILPTDPRFLDMTALDIQTEYWAHHYADTPEGESFEDDDFDLDEIIREMDDDDWDEVSLDD